MLLSDVPYTYHFFSEVKEGYELCVIETQMYSDQFIDNQIKQVFVGGECLLVEERHNCKRCTPNTKRYKQEPIWTKEQFKALCASAKYVSSTDDHSLKFHHIYS